MIPAQVWHGLLVCHYVIFQAVRPELLILISVHQPLETVLKDLQHAGGQKVSQGHGLGLLPMPGHTLLGQVAHYGAGTCLHEDRELSLGEHCVHGILVSQHQLREALDQRHQCVLGCLRALVIVLATSSLGLLRARPCGFLRRGCGGQRCLQARCLTSLCPLRPWLM